MSHAAQKCLLEPWLQRCCALQPAGKGPVFSHQNLLLMLSDHLSTVRRIVTAMVKVYRPLHWPNLMQECLFSQKP